MYKQKVFSGVKKNNQALHKIKIHNHANKLFFGHIPI